jgi:hypothetical protein
MVETVNLHDALGTANWLLSRCYIEDRDPEGILRIRQMRDTLYYLHAAAGITEIRLDAYELGQKAGHPENNED